MCEYNPTDIYLLSHLPVVVAGVHSGHDIQHTCDNHGDVNGRVAQEVGVREHIAPIDGVGHHNPAASKGGQMVTPTGSARGAGLFTNLEIKIYQHREWDLSKIF